MKTETLVVVGANAAGMSATSKLRRLNADKKIIVFEKSKHPSYAACNMPYFIAGKVHSVENLIVRTPEEFLENQNINPPTGDDREDCLACHAIDSKVLPDPAYYKGRKNDVCSDCHVQRELK
ncbi:MAG: cytochrome c3 family protein [bacterium]|nr:cytochrome c3 family protein [bacterium]